MRQTPWEENAGGDGEERDRQEQEAGGAQRD